MATRQLFERGFKAYAEREALAIRRELGLDDRDAFDTSAMAEHLDVPILPLSSIRDEVPEAFSEEASGKFSALLMPIGRSRRGIVLNDAHHPVRCASSLCHEFGHLVLGHSCHEPFLDNGTRNYKSTIENEANEFGGWLLVTRTVALDTARLPSSHPQQARRLGVSEQYLTWRLRMSGATTQAGREALKRR